MPLVLFENSLTMTDEKRIILGKLGSVYGVHGWLRVHSFTDPASNISQYPVWQIQHNKQWHNVPIDKIKAHNNGLVVLLKGINNREIARTYTNDMIAVYQSELPKLEDHEYYWSDLIGLNVITTQGVELGKITQLQETGSNDVLIVKGKRERLIPYTEDTVIAINLKDHLMTVEWDPDF